MNFYLGVRLFLITLNILFFYSHSLSISKWYVLTIKLGKQLGSNVTQSNPINEGDSVLKITDALKEAKIWEFYLIEFDTDLEKYQKLEKSDYMNNKDVLELYESFSCFFR